MRRDSLLTPLVFAALVLAAGAASRLLIDADRPASAEGTPGKLVWILAPALLAVVFRRLDPATRSEHLFAFTRVGVRFALSVAAAGGAAVCALIVLGLLTGSATWVPVPAAASNLASTAAGLAVFAFLEESAWRGYLLPALLARASVPLAVAVAAITWFGWHLPYLDQLAAAYTDEALATLAPRLLLGVAAMQWLYTELFLRCRSVWPAFALHATMNLVAMLALACGLRLIGARTWLFSPSADGVIVVALCCAAGFWLSVRRCRGSCGRS